MRLYGSASCDPHINGGFEEFILAPAANAFAVPEALSWGEAAMAEPLSVAAHAAGRADSLAGQAVLVTGGGAIGQVGTLPPSVTLPLNIVMARELTLLGFFRFANVCPTAIELRASGRIDVKPLITSVYPLAELGAAMQTAINAPQGIKVQIAA